MKTQIFERSQFRLDSMPSAKCHIEIVHSNEEIVRISLISYSTYVIDIRIINNESPREKYKFAGVVYCYPGNGSYSYNCSDWTYSPTTARHINRFTKEFFGENLYHQVKRFAENSNCAFKVCNVDSIVSRAKWYLENGKPYYWKY